MPPDARLTAKLSSACTSASTPFKASTTLFCRSFTVILVVAFSKWVVVYCSRPRGPGHLKPLEVQNEKFRWCFLPDVFFLD